MACTYDEVIAVISRPPDERTEFGINNVLPWFRKKSDLFKNLKSDCLYDLIQHLQFVKLEKDKVMIRQGEIGNCMYILMRGKVTIYILYATRDEEAEEAHVGSTRPRAERDQDTTDIRHQLGTVVTSLGPGATFGEVALISEDCIRTASIITDEPSDVIVVDKQLYNRSVKELLQKEFEDKHRFVSENLFFSNWSARYKKQLTMALQRQIIPYDAPLVKQGAPVSGMYFLLSGEMKVLMDSTQHRQQYPKLCPAPTGHWRRTEAKSKSTHSNEGFRPKKREHRSTEELCLLGMNEVIGDVEVMFGLPTFIQTVVSTHKSEVLFLEMKHIERLLLKRHPKTTKSIKSDLELKLQARKSQLLERNIPIISSLVTLAENFNAALKYQNDIRSMDPSKRHVETKPSRNKLADVYDTFIPTQGALVDMYAEGTVFHRIRERDKIKRKEASLQTSYDVAYSPEQKGHQTNNFNKAYQDRKSTFAPGKDSDSPTELDNRVRIWLNKDFDVAE